MIWNIGSTLASPLVVAASLQVGMANLQQQTGIACVNTTSVAIVVDRRAAQDDAHSLTYALLRLQEENQGSFPCSVLTLSSEQSHDFSSAGAVFTYAGRNYVIYLLPAESFRYRLFLKELP